MLCFDSNWEIEKEKLLLLTSNHNIEAITIMTTSVADRRHLYNGKRNRKRDRDREKEQQICYKPSNNINNSQNKTNQLFPFPSKEWNWIWNSLRIISRRQTHVYICTHTRTHSRSHTICNCLCIWIKTYRFEIRDYLIEYGNLRIIKAKVGWMEIEEEEKIKWSGKQTIRKCNWSQNKTKKK